MRRMSLRAAMAAQAGRDWADREADALIGVPTGAWRSTSRDALPLVDSDPLLAEVAHVAAVARWTEIVAASEAEVASRPLSERAGWPR